MVLYIYLGNNLVLIAITRWSAQDLGGSDLNEVDADDGRMWRNGSVYTRSGNLTTGGDWLPP